MSIAIPAAGFRPVPLLVWMAGSALVLTSLPSRAQSLDNMRDQLIIHYCTLAVNADFTKAGKTAPDGLAKDTCTCVAEQVNARATIPQAEAICKQQAMGKYNLSP